MQDTPSSPLLRFQRLYGELARDRSWKTDVQALRLAALLGAAPADPGTVTGEALEREAAALQAGGGWNDRLRTALRYPAAAALLCAGDTASGLRAEVGRVRPLLRARRLRGGGFFEVVAITVLRHRLALAPIQPEHIDRWAEVYAGLKRHHWWLTGPSDYPYCALVAAGTGPVEAVAERIEEISQALAQEGLRGRFAVRRAALGLGLTSQPPLVLAQQMVGLVTELKVHRVSVWSSDYASVAPLATLALPPFQVVEELLAIRQEVRGIEPRPGWADAFWVAAGLMLLGRKPDEPVWSLLLAARALMRLQQIHQQRAAAASAGC